MAEPPALVPVGQVLGAFGVRGEVRIRPFTEEPAGIAAYGPLYDADGRVLFKIVRLRPIKGAVAAVTDPGLAREAAEAMRGALLHVPRAALPAPEAEDFYIVDLIGCRAEDEAGADLGHVVAVHDFGAGDLLEVRGADGATRYVPFTKAAVPSVEIAARRIILAPD